MPMRVLSMITAVCAVAATAFARIFPSRWIAHIPAQSSHLSLVRVRALPEVAAWRSPCRPPGGWVRGLGLRGDEANAIRGEEELMAAVQGGDHVLIDATERAYRRSQED